MNLCRSAVIDTWIDFIVSAWTLIASEVLFNDIPTFILSVLADSQKGGELSVAGEVGILAMMNMSTASLDLLMKVADAIDAWMEFKEKKKKIADAIDARMEFKEGVPSIQHQGQNFGGATQQIMSIMKVQCPPGAAPGTLVQCQAPDGQTVQVEAPLGISPG